MKASQLMILVSNCGCLKNFALSLVSVTPSWSMFKRHGAFPIWARHTRNFVVKGQRSRESLFLIFLPPQTRYHKHLDYGQSTFFVLFSFFFAFFLSEKPSLREKQKKLENPNKILHLRREPDTSSTASTSLSPNPFHHLRLCATQHSDNLRTSPQF